MKGLSCAMSIVLAVHCAGAVAKEYGGQGLLLKCVIIKLRWEGL